MPVIVNAYELSDAEMEQELPAHQQAADPMQRAMTALVLRRVLMDEAAQSGITGSEDEKIEALLARELLVPVPSEAEIYRHYETHLHAFTVGELVEANHILFQVTEHLDLQKLRSKAEQVLALILDDPSQFSQLARAYSNCPSSEVGGSLGQLARGDTVKEFEKALFLAEENTVIPYLVETRFGLHIIQLGRKLAGRVLEFEQLSASIAEAMRAASYDRALRQYLKLIVGRAKISGIDLAGAENSLVQ